jgi:hypothetical protein
MKAPSGLVSGREVSVFDTCRFDFSATCAKFAVERWSRQCRRRTAIRSRARCRSRAQCRRRSARRSRGRGRRARLIRRRASRALRLPRRGVRPRRRTTAVGAGRGAGRGASARATRSRSARWGSGLGYLERHGSSVRRCAGPARDNLSSTRPSWAAGTRCRSRPGQLGRRCALSVPVWTGEARRRDRPAHDCVR